MLHVIKFVVADVLFSERSQMGHSATFHSLKLALTLQGNIIFKTPL